MGKEELDDEDTVGADLIAVPSNKTAEADVVLPSGPLTEPDEPAYKRKSLFTSFGRLIYEQRIQWVLYCIEILGALGGGVVYPLQAYLFAQLVNTFTLAGQALVNSGNHWALMFFMQAIGVGVAYFIMGWSSHLVSIVVSTYYRKEYLEHILDKRIAFFDAEGNSSGTLTSSLSNDPHRVEAMLGTEMGMALVAVVNLLGCIIISFIFGWKLSLVGILTIMPVILAAGFLRLKLEMQFEELNAAVFAESSQFGTEAIGAFRTVMSA